MFYNCGRWTRSCSINVVDGLGRVQKLWSMDVFYNCGRWTRSCSINVVDGLARVL